MNELQLPSQNHTCYPVDKPPQTTTQRQSRSHLGLPSFPGCIPSSLPPAVHLEKPHVSSHPSPFVPSDAAMEAAFSKTRLKPIDLIPPDAGQWRIVRGDPGSSRPRTPPVAPFKQSMMETSPGHGIPDSVRASPRLERPGAQTSRTPGRATAPSGCGCPPQRVLRAAFPVLALGIYGCIPSSLPQPFALRRSPTP